MKLYGYTTLGFFIVAFGCALNIQANVGLGAWDALANSTSHIIGLQIGTVGIIYNCCCILIQKLILKNQFTWRHFLQIPFSILLGTCINLFTVHLSFLSTSSSILACFYSFLSYIICAFGIAFVLLSHKVSFALEGACLAYASTNQKNFAHVRQIVDIVCILLICILTFLFRIPFTLGLGTIIGAITFSPLLAFFMEKLQRILHSS